MSRNPLSDPLFLAMMQAQAAAPFDPASLSPILWYDFADESTVTVNAGRADAIEDKGSRGWDLTAFGTAPLYGPGIGGKNCIDWGNVAHSNRLRNTSSTATEIGEFYIVLDAAFGGQFPTLNGLISVATTTPGGFYLAGESGRSRFFTDFTSRVASGAFINNSTFNAYDVSVLPALNSPCVLRILKTNGQPLLLDSGFQIGMNRNSTEPGRGWRGLIGEVIGFQAPLSAGDRTNLLNHFYSEWSITP